MNQSYFPAPDKKPINDQELDILKYWQENDIFEKTISERSKKNEFRFFDGPPFATGSPHYGHILAGAIKDTIPRYKTMLGHRVERKWGWDCHGVPLEFLIEKEHNIGGKPGIEKMGVGPFNELCRDAVMRCADEWESTVHRMGRFVDFKDDYKTMDPEFMESVWWVFQTLWDKGLIYEGEKVVAYSPKLGSPLSNFEANLNYQSIDDPAVTIKFKLETGEYVLAWTTTPWTLPSNVALGFGRDTEYSLIEHEGDQYWTASALIEKHFGEDAKVVKTQIGKDFLDLEYTPLFNFFADKEKHKRFVCIHDDGDYVSTESGTGIVHFAPSFGAEDADLCFKFNIYGVNPIDENGYFDETVPPLQGKYFRADNEVDGSKEDNANKWVIANLKETNQLFKLDQIRHEYPFCWRTDCALMYRGLKTWFVNVAKIKETMVEQNQNVNWLPDHLRDGRFGKLLESAPDWAISRNRYWGAPIPVWRGEKTGKIIVIGSREELETKTGQVVEDLHKHFVDDLTWEEDGEIFRRIPEVLDCWFESGAMPYASVHYPFKNKDQIDEIVKGNFDFPPADFIAEGLDQTRGWFYSLHVLGCALFGKNIYKNVITNGIVLAEDGQKMSKSKKNYPDPNLIFDQYGADAMRFYMLSSPVVRAENFRFAEQGVAEILKTVLLPLKSTYQFFSTYANIDDWKPTTINFIRHGEGEHNVAGIYSGKADNPHQLTDKGVADCEALKAHLPNFDQVYVSPFVRTKQTADILFGAGNYQLNDDIVEIDFGNLEGKPYRPVKERLQNPTGEKLESVQSRMSQFIQDIAKNHPGERVAVVSHGGAIRYGRAAFDGYDTIEEVLNYDIVKPGETANFICPPNPTTELDQWIISELQLLLQNFRDKMDAYKIDEALREIAPFIDNLNNWYLRRSRKRFWAEGMNADKASGYETLHYVLRTLSKILAPSMPFFGESLYKDLTDGGSLFPENNSVHLQYLPDFEAKHINQPLSDKIRLMREVVSLSAGIRARAKIKLRQPLGKLQFAISGEQAGLLNREDLQIIAAETNVKNVEILDSVEGLAQQIIKVDAKQVGRKFGKKTQELIQAGKAGDYTMNDDGTVELCGEKIQAGEYELNFICEEGLEAEATPNVVVLLDTEISNELEIEGYAREIIRAVQDLRKSSGFEVSDRINVTYQTDSEKLQQTLATHQETIGNEVLAENINAGTADATIEIEGQSLGLKLEKV